MPAPGGRSRPTACQLPLRRLAGGDVSPKGPRRLLAAPCWVDFGRCPAGASSRHARAPCPRGRERICSGRGTEQQVNRARRAPPTRLKDSPSATTQRRLGGARPQRWGAGPRRQHVLWTRCVLPASAAPPLSAAGCGASRLLVPLPPDPQWPRARPRSCPSLSDDARPLRCGRRTGRALGSGGSSAPTLRAAARGCRSVASLRLCRPRQA